MSTTPEEKPSAPSPTLTTSSASVRVFWLNRPQILQRLRKAVQELTTRHPEIEQVILFGSLARGDAVPGSDADLLIIVHDSPLSFLARSVHYRPAHLGIGVDVLVYTQAEFKTLRAADNPFVVQALHEGMRLFQRP